MTGRYRNEAREAEFWLDRKHPELSPDFLDQIKKDFYLSFKYSQGKLQIQELLFGHLNRHYTARYGSEQLDQVVKADKLVVQALGGFLIPKSHLAKQGHNAQSTLLSGENGGFVEVAEKFMHYIGWPFAGDVEELGAMLVQRDLDYQGDSKNRYYQTTDPSASYFRRYVVLGEPAGSETFEAIFQEVQQAYFAPDAVVQPENVRLLIELTHAWEANHPDEQFVPPLAS